MKKIVSLCLVLGLLASCAFAMPSGVLPYGIGAKYAAMGGAGSALVDDITSAYYNPAGIVRSQALSLKLGAGTASNGLDQLSKVLGSISTPSKFLADNYANSLSINGNMNLSLGLTLAKVGISVIPVTSLNISKGPDTLSGTAAATLKSDAALTIGKGFSLPMLPIADLNVGANIKYIYNVNASTSISGSTGTDNSDAYTGTGFDIGAQTSLNTLLVPVSVALVYKDLGANLTGKRTTTVTTYDNTGKATGSDTTNSDLPGTAVPTTFVIGAATVIPVAGIKVAADLDSVSGSGISYSVTHLGFEYPVIVGMIALRAGIISGGPSGAPINMTTYGAGILGSMINIAMISDNNNSANNQTLVDIGFGF